MNKLMIAVLAAVLAAPAVSLAGEHPSEHPTTHSSRRKKKQEHPKGKHEHPKKKYKKKGKWVSHKKTMKAFVKAVVGHVKMKVADEGSFNVYDDKLDKTWELKLVRIHKKRIARLGENKFFACADFKTVAKGKRTKLDLDFFVSRKDGDFIVDEVLVHKVNGKPRYTYNSKNQRVPVKAKKHVHEHPKGGKHEHPKGKAKHEHPKGKAKHEHPKGGEHPR